MKIKWWAWCRGLDKEENIIDVGGEKILEGRYEVAWEELRLASDTMISYNLKNIKASFIQIYVVTSNI